MVKNILIIKLGALGDVIRTLPIAKALKEKYHDSIISWITKENAISLFSNNSDVDKVYSLSNYPKDSYDLLYNFDIEEEACKIAKELNVKEKYGFYFEEGYPAAFNPGSEYYLNTLYDDELKRENKKTYQQMMFDVAELNYNKEHCEIFLTDEEKNYAKEFINSNQINTENLIGIHIGSSPRWPSKAWHNENIKNFIIKAKENGYEIILFAGPDDITKQDELYNELKNQEIKVFRNNPNNSLREFASLVDICKLIICSDSLAMHVSLALKKQTIALFFCTTPHEVEDYELLTKIVSPKLYEFFPEKMDEYDSELVKSISSEEVLKQVNKLLNSKKVVNAIVKHPDKEKFLIIKRKYGIHSGKWAFPGGIIEEGESNEQALKRELLEETNLELDSIIKEISNYSYPREDKTLTKGKCFLVKTKNHNVRLNNESSEFKWVAIEELETLNHVRGLDEEVLIVLDNKNK